jgi:hypothetical protein
MYEKSCRCGASKKNFKIDIGPFYIAECCKKAGFDHLGNRLEAKDIGLTEEVVQKITESKETLAVEDDSDLDTDESKADKKKRRYNRGGNIKKES